MRGLPLTGAKLFVRREGFVIVGFLVEKYQRVDTSSGDMRNWGFIKTLNWENLDEPLDRKNRLTGEIETCICWENNQIVITARRTKDIRDDEDNFQWLIGAPDANAWKELRENIKLLEKTIHSLERELEGKNVLIARLTPQVEGLGTENTSLKNDLDFLWPDYVAKGRQLSWAYLQLQGAIALTREMYGAMEEIGRTARDRGIDMGSSDMDRLSRSAEKTKAFLSQLAASIPASGAVSESNIDDALMALRNKIDQALQGGKKPALEGPAGTPAGAPGTPAAT
jgi:chromosome segregation ATPase